MNPPKSREEIMDLIGQIALQVKNLADDAERRNAEAERSNAEAERSNAEAKRRNAEISEQIEALSLKAERRNAEIDKKIDKLVQSTQEHGNYINNASVQAERYFQNAIENNGFLVGGIQFNELQRNTERSNRMMKVEFDGLLLNGRYAGILEVKTTLHLNDIEKIARKPRKFRKLFGEYADKELLIVVAGKVVHEDAADKARSYGFMILEPDGESIKVDDSCVKYY